MSRTEPNPNRLFESSVEPNRTRTGKVRFDSLSDTFILFILDHFTVDADFTGIDAVEKDLQFVFKARHDIQTQAQDVLENGLNHLVCYKKKLFLIEKLFIYRILLKLVQLYKYFLI